MKQTNEMTYRKIDIFNSSLYYRQLVSPKNAHKEPIVILAGLRDRFDNHDDEITRLAVDYPVYLVHLPGFGESLEVGSELSYKDYAKILSGFLESVGVSKCSLVAHTYTANIAKAFYDHAIEKVGYLFLVAPVMRMRESVKFIMKKSIESLESGDAKSFAARQSIHFIPTFTEDYSLKKKEAVQDYYLNLLNHDEVSKQQFCAHIKRLDNIDDKRDEHFGVRECSTVVITGERDLLTTPKEAYDYANTCSDSTFVSIDDSDQLLALDKASTLVRIIKRSLDGKSLKRMRGLKIIETHESEKNFSRVRKRFAVDEKGLVELGSGQKIIANFEALSAFGCMFKVEKSQFGKSEIENISHSLEKLTLNFCDITVDAKVLASKSNGELCAVFSFDSFEQHEKLHNYLAKIS